LKKKKRIVKQYKGLISDEAMQRLNDDIKEDLKKRIEASKKEVARLRRRLSEGKGLAWS
jgi:uncharacterized protein YceH (UPF0502 family)